MKTYSPKPVDIHRDWWVVDAEGAVLGRLATQIANVLRGKNKPMFAPHMDVGDHVIVVNADKIVLTGRKLEQKELLRYSGYHGGLRRIPYDKLLREHPDRVIRKAVRGMLPKNRLGRQVIRKLKVYAGPDHPHSAQGPQVLEIEHTRRGLSEA
ncbi:MAG: 50S ribosomal protein L13 [Candidatus Eisenbacteria sp.]|nr:50S ribosomal protein L13 [Candidatus Eisenbacteria bacterium]